MQTGEKYGNILSLGNTSSVGKCTLEIQCKHGHILQSSLHIGCKIMLDSCISLLAEIQCTELSRLRSKSTALTRNDSSLQAGQRFEMFISGATTT